MKILSAGVLALSIALVTVNASAQRIRTKEGNTSILKNETSVNIEFTFENVRVGKFSKEEDYIKSKRDEYNKKETGRGDTWASRWKDDQQNRYPDDFINLFTKTSDMTIKKEAKYTLIFHTTSIEPGFNIGITRKNAYIDGEILIVETANRTNILARLTIDDARGNAFWGNDFDTGERISESYAKAGKELGSYLR